MSEVKGSSADDAGVLVAIPCLNEAANLPQVLTSLLEDPALHGARVVVADGGSTDGSRKIVEGWPDPRVQLLENPKRLQSVGINRAVAAFGADRQVLVRIDAHARYPRHYVSGLLQAWRSSGAESVVVPMKSQGVGCFQIGAAAAQDSPIGNGGARHRRPHAGGWVDHGHHALIALKAFRGVGGYDEGFSHNEDAEFDARLREAGGRIWLEDSLLITYFPRATAIGLFVQYLKFGGGRARNLIRHRSPPRLRQLAPTLVAPAALLACAAPWAPLCGLPLLLWATACLLVGLCLGVARRSLCVASAGAAALIMHFSWSWGFWAAILKAGLSRTPPPQLGRFDPPRSGP